MIRILILLSLLAWAACGQAVYRLDVGAERMAITDNGETSYLSLPLNGGARNYVTIWWNKFEVRGTNIVDCANPCSVEVDRRTYGTPYYFREVLDGSNNVVRKGLQQLSPRTIEESTFTMPIHVIGTAPFSRLLRVATEATSSNAGQIRLWMIAFGLSYDTKARVRVNKTGYIEIKKSNVTVLRDRGNWTHPSLDIGEAFWEFTVDVPDPAVGAINTVELQHWREKWGRDERGWRVAEFNFLQPNVSVSNISVASGVATFTTSAPHGYSSGNDVLGINIPAKFVWRANRILTNITVTSATTFTVPVTSEFDETLNHAGMAVARAMIDVDSFTQEDPSTFTAPSGGNAANGETAWRTAALKGPSTPGYAMNAKCTNCHAQDGRDLKYFGFTNQSIVHSCKWHGLDDTACRDIAAYIRANPSSSPGSPISLVHQPCPAADSVPIDQWDVACNYKEVVPYDISMYGDLCGAVCEADDFSPGIADTRHWRNQRSHMQMFAWNQLLPRIHPLDSYTSTGTTQGYRTWANSEFAIAYGELRAALSAHCPTPDCAAELNGTTNPGAVGWYDIRFGKIGGKGFTNYQTGPAVGPACGGGGYPADFACAGVTTTERNQLAVIGTSTGQLAAVKAWELTHEFGLAQYGAGHYWKDSITGRHLQWRAAFGQSPNLLQTLKANGIPGIEDGSPFAEKMKSYKWYLWAAIIAPDGNWWGFDTISPLDIGYWHGYVKDVYYGGGVRLPLSTVQMIQQNTRRLRNRAPAADNNVTSWRGVDLINPSLLTDRDFTPTWLGVPSGIRVPTYQEILNAVHTAFWGIVGGTVTNGSAGTFTLSQFSYWNGANWTNTNLGICGHCGMGHLMWHSLIYGKAAGLNATVRGSIANTYGPTIIGVRNWSTALSQTACELDLASFRIVAVGGGNCDGVAPAP